MDVALSAGAGDILGDIEAEPESSAESLHTDFSTENIDDIDNTENSTENNTETASTEIQDEIGLSAGAGEVFEKAGEEVKVYTAQAEDLEIDKQIETQEEVQAEEQPETHWGYTNLGIAHVDNHLNIRQEPNENGKLIGKLSKDAACEVLEIDENGWAHIKSGKVEGYCSTEFLYLGDAAIARGHEAASMIAVVNTQTLKVREEPNTDSIVITLIPQEEELEVVEIMENGWIKFLLDDEEAYVSGEYVDVEERLEKAVTLTELLYGQGVSNVRVDLVQYAKQFVGNPYVWGGTSLTNGADCSGFTLSIYKKYGVSLPHHAASQAQMGTKIDYNSVQPGDLVFYAKNGSINHVAIYIGNGQVIHASSPKTGIKISSWNYRTPACIRRYLSN
ncbi:MAG: C40 family peptidase [Lachnospiraceae bacterium]|nr:C40 family peptidase [Lachnospiraceae bacterium]